MTTFLITAYSPDVNLNLFVCATEALGSVNTSVDCRSSATESEEPVVPARGAAAGAAAVGGFVSASQPGICIQGTAVYPGPILTPGFIESACYDFAR